MITSDQMFHRFIKSNLDSSGALTTLKSFQKDLR